MPVSTELYSVSQIAAVVLLFVAGLETDLKQFLRFAGPASAVAMGGVVFPFLFGVGATLLFAPGNLEGESLLHAALFVGAVMTATSVGITARVLNDIGRLDSPEGVTILAGAVVDDVLGILVLTIVVGLAEPDQQATVGSVALVGVKAVGFWLALMAGGILCAKYISTALRSFKVSGSAIALALALAFLAAGLAESFGLAMIIGAYTIGLALSGTPLARQLEEPIMSVYHALVPIFFVVMGNAGGRYGNGGRSAVRRRGVGSCDHRQGGGLRGAGVARWVQQGRLVANRHWDAAARGGGVDHRGHWAIAGDNRLGRVRRGDSDDGCDHLHSARSSWCRPLRVAAKASDDARRRLPAGTLGWYSSACQPPRMRRRRRVAVGGWSQQTSPCSSEDRALASEARCVGSSPARGTTVDAANCGLLRLRSC